MAALAINSSAVRWMEARGIMSASFGRDRIAEQRLARFHMGELDRCIAHVDASILLTRHGECRSGKIARLRKIGPVMRAARILAADSRERNDAADLAQRTQIEPIMPGQIEAAVAFGDAGGKEYRLDGIDCRKAALYPGAIAHDADMIPHHVEELLPQGVGIPRRARKRVLGARHFKSEHFRVRRAMAWILGNPARHHVSGDAA